MYSMEVFTPIGFWFCRQDFFKVCTIHCGEIVPAPSVKMKGGAFFSFRIKIAQADSDEKMLFASSSVAVFAA